MGYSIGEFCLGFFFFLVFISGFSGCMVNLGSSYQKEQAIKAGVAYYSVDAVTGETKFNYKDNCK